MTVVLQKFSCSQCCAELDELPSTPIGARKPCSNCGSLVRTLYVNISETVQVRTLMKLKHKEIGRKKPKAEITSGEDLHRDSGRWMYLERVLDRGKNWYKETVTDILTGEVRRYVDEPLDQHVGRGSDKNKKKR